MRIGYLFRGFLGDVKMDSTGLPVSSPDGNATYSWSIEHECNRRGYKLIPLGENLDAPAADLMGENLFSAFSEQKRSRSYERMLRCGWSRLSDCRFPDLDLVLIEWRWPIPGRNTPDDVQSIEYQRDLERQREVLLHYSDVGTPIVAWDLDHKLSVDDQDMWSLAGVGFHVIETSVAASLAGRTRVEPPAVVADLLQHDIDIRQPSHHLGYVGSRYERDETIDEWIAPVSPAKTRRTKLWGKWEPGDEVRARWPGITFAGRIGVREFYSAYSRVAAVPLLAKRSYYETGFITPRPWEAILFGSIPVGLSCHLGIEQYVSRVATSPDLLLSMASELKTVSPLRRRIMREEAAHRLAHMDVKNFVNVLEGLSNGALADTEILDEPTEKEKGDPDGKE